MSRRCLICANINPCSLHSEYAQDAELGRNMREVAAIEAKRAALRIEARQRQDGATRLGPEGESLTPKGERPDYIAIACTNILTNQLHRNIRIMQGNEK